MVTQSSYLRSSAAVLALFAVSCGAHDEGGAEETVSVVSDTGMDWDTFRATALVGPNGSLVVEGDMAFHDEEALYEYWAEVIGPGRGEALTVNRRTVGGVPVDDIWAFPARFALTYCVGTGFTATQSAALLPALDAATNAWSRIVGVRFQRTTPSGTCNSSNNNVVFDVQRITGGSFFGLAFFPGDPRSARTLFIDDTAFTTSAGGRTLTGIITHELGHAIGFRHEHIWISCTGESTLNARQVTAYDEMSVMHYPQCRDPQGGGYSVSLRDYQGGVQLYGLAPALTRTVVGAPLLE